MSGAAAATAAGPTTYLVLVLLVTCSAVLLVRGTRGMARSWSAPPVPECRSVPPAAQQPAEGELTYVVVMRLGPRRLPAVHRPRRPLLGDDDVISFGLELEASDDVVAAVLAESPRVADAPRPES